MYTSTPRQFIQVIADRTHNHLSENGDDTFGHDVGEYDPPDRFNPLAIFPLNSLRLRWDEHFAADQKPDERYGEVRPNIEVIDHP